MKEHGFIPGWKSAHEGRGGLGFPRGQQILCEGELNPETGDISCALAFPPCETLYILVHFSAKANGHDGKKVHQALSSIQSPNSDSEPTLTATH